MGQPIDFDVPCSGLVIGNSGSGKTHLIRQLLKTTFRARFKEIFIFCPTMEYSQDYDFLKDRPEYKNRLYDKFDEELIGEIIGEQKYLIKRYGKARTPQVLILLDDCLESIQGNSNIVNTLYFKGRHWNISCFCLVQRMRGLGTILRLNARFIIFFRSANQAEQDHVLDEYCGRAQKRLVAEQMTEWFKEPYSYIVMDLKNQDFTKRFGLGVGGKIVRYIDYLTS